MDEDDTGDEFSFNIFSATQKHDRVIVHIDIDCFYAQVEMILDPSLRGKPVGIKQKNIVVTCNYEARALGIEKLMSLKTAVEKCPSLIIVNGEDLKKYRDMSEKIYQVLQSFSPHVEKLGMDENFIDITHKISKSYDVTPQISGHIYHKETENCECGCADRLAEGSVIAQEMRSQLKSELGITSCAGIAYNKLLAKLVGTTHKPDQQTTLFSTSSLKLIKSLKSPRNIPGIGSSTYKKLESLGIKTIELLQTADIAKLNQAFGAKVANQIHKMSFGIDDSRVKITDKPKSIGAEDGFPTIKTESEVRMKMKCLLDRVWPLVEKDGRRPSQVKLTVRKLHPTNHSVRESRQTSLDLTIGGGNTVPVGPLNQCQETKIITVLMSLFEKVVSGDSSWQVTLLGISFSGLPGGTSESPAKNSMHKYLTAGSSRPNEAPPPLPPAKRGRFDESVLQELPPEIRQEILEDMEKQSSSEPQATNLPCPKGVDPQVFHQLPPEIQQELLAGHQEKKPVNSVKKSNNLLQYFRKL